MTFLCVTISHAKYYAKSHHPLKQDCRLTVYLMEKYDSGQLWCLYISWLFVEHKRELLDKEKQVWLFTHTLRQALKSSWKHSFKKSVAVTAVWTGGMSILWFVLSQLLLGAVLLAWNIYMGFAHMNNAYVKSEMAARRQSHGEEKYSDFFFFSSFLSMRNIADHFELEKK